MSSDKSSRHSKIIGNTGELIICNWLSKSGFEIAVVDHTGIDLVAYHKEQKKRIGITVKSRTRNEANEFSSVNIFTKEQDEKYVQSAKEYFECKEIWIGVYVEAETKGYIFLCEKDYYQQTYSTGGKTLSWNMSEAKISDYKKDKKVKLVEIQFTKTNWDWSSDF